LNVTGRTPVPAHDGVDQALELGAFELRLEVAGIRVERRDGLQVGRRHPGMQVGADLCRAVGGEPRQHVGAGRSRGDRMIDHVGRTDAELAEHTVHWHEPGDRGDRAVIPIERGRPVELFLGIDHDQQDNGAPPGGKRAGEVEPRSSPRRESRDIWPPRNGAAASLESSLPGRMFRTGPSLRAMVAQTGGIGTPTIRRFCAQARI
jgi:hypothetical protein